MSKEVKIAYRFRQELKTIYQNIKKYTATRSSNTFFQILFQFCYSEKTIPCHSTQLNELNVQLVLYQYKGRIYMYGEPHYKSTAKPLHFYDGNSYTDKTF